MNGGVVQQDRRKIRGKNKEYVKKIRQNLGGLFSVLAFSITIFFNSCSSRVIRQRIQ
jgi:hypothetical protein